MLLLPVLSSYRSSSPLRSSSSSSSSPSRHIAVSRASRRRGKSHSSVSRGINRISELYRIRLPSTPTLSVSILLGILRFVVCSSPHLPRNIPFVPRHVPRREKSHSTLTSRSPRAPWLFHIYGMLDNHIIFRHSSSMPERKREKRILISAAAAFDLLPPLLRSRRTGHVGIKFRKLRPVNRDTRVEREPNFSIYLASTRTDLTDRLLRSEVI